MHAWMQCVQCSWTWAVGWWKKRSFTVFSGRSVWGTVTTWLQKETLHAQLLHVCSWYLCLCVIRFGQDWASVVTSFQSERKNDRIGCKDEHDSASVETSLRLERRKDRIRYKNKHDWASVATSLRLEGRGGRIGYKSSPNSATGLHSSFQEPPISTGLGDCSDFDLADISVRSPIHLFICSTQTTFSASTYPKNSSTAF